MHESLEELQELEQHYRGEPQEIRLKVLRLLKENPVYTTEQIGELLGCSERTVRRWWSSYLRDGLGSLLEVRAGEKEEVTNADSKKWEILEKKIRQKEIADLKDARSWLTERSGIWYTRSEVQYLLYGKLKKTPPWPMPPHSCKNGVTFDGSVFAGSQLHIPAKILYFLNELPLTDNTNQWSNCFRSALLSLFQDIDHIAININQACDLKSPVDYTPTIVLRQHVSSIDAPERGVVVGMPADEGRPSERMMEEFRLQGRPLENYHPPHSFNYYYAGYAYLGTIFLFRESHKSGISGQTLETLDALEPFLIYVIANHVIWYQQNRPAEQLFQDGLTRLNREAGLSIQEQRVVIYHLLGYSYEEMANLLAISTKTVKKHISTIHQKTGTHRQRELFAQYFSPRIGFGRGMENE